MVSLNQKQAVELAYEYEEVHDTGYDFSDVNILAEYLVRRPSAKAAYELNRLKRKKEQHEDIRLWF